ncbi:MAG: hypothetical protein HUK11_01010 [Muribaculaceae bacterium]|nr:hypothetical protein [Muribaculaceae bacterium]
MGAKLGKSGENRGAKLGKSGENRGVKLGKSGENRSKKWEKVVFLTTKICLTHCLLLLLHHKNNFSNVKKKIFHNN